MARNIYATQGRLLIAALKRRPHTYMDMLKHGISCSPWKRIAESLRSEECIVKRMDGQGRTTWRVIQATRWTA
jgi:hypothetical protein